MRAIKAFDEFSKLILFFNFYNMNGKSPKILPFGLLTVLLLFTGKGDPKQRNDIFDIEKGNPIQLIGIFNVDVGDLKQQIGIFNVENGNPKQQNGIFDLLTDDYKGLIKINC